MPIYEYECPQCGKFEQIHLAGEKSLTACPTCKEKGKKTKVQKLTSAAGLRFKGSGFYITDYTNKSGENSEGSKKASKSSNDSPKSDSTEKPATASEKPADKKKAPESKPKEGK